MYFVISTRYHSNLVWQGLEGKDAVWALCVQKRSHHGEQEENYHANESFCLNHHPCFAVAWAFDRYHLVPPRDCLYLLCHKLWYGVQDVHERLWSDPKSLRHHELDDGVVAKVLKDNFEYINWKTIRVIVTYHFYWVDLLYNLLAYLDATFSKRRKKKSTIHAYANLNPIFHFPQHNIHTRT